MNDYEVSLSKELAEFVALQSLPTDVINKVYEMPVCARMPLLLLYKTSNRNSEFKQKFAFLFKLYQLVVKLYKQNCPTNADNKPDICLGYLKLTSVCLPNNCSWDLLEPHFKKASAEGSQTSQYILDYRNEFVEVLRDTFGENIPKNVLNYLSVFLLQCLADYAADVHTLYSKAERSCFDKKRLNSDNNEYFRHRREFRLLNNRILLGFKQITPKEIEKFFTPYWF